MAHSQQQQQQQKHLKELLLEDQEPFQLSSYIADKRSKLSNHLWKRPHRQKHTQQQPQPPSLHLRKQPPNKSSVSQNAPFSVKFCKDAACFPFSYSCSSPFDSPDHFRKSPILVSPRNKSPINIKGSSSNSSPSRAALPLRVPAKTATLLLEAALRIQNSSSNNSNKPPNSKSHLKNSGLGLLGSVIRRVTTHHRRSTLKDLRRTGESETGEVVNWADNSVKFDAGRKSKLSRKDISSAETRGECDMGIGGNYEHDTVDDQTRGSDGKLARFWSEEMIKSEEGSSGCSSSSTSSSSCCTSSYSIGDCCRNIIRDESDDEDEEVASVSSSGRDKNCIIVDGSSAANDFTFCLSPFRFGYLDDNSPSSPPGCRPNSPANNKSPSRFNFEERAIFEKQQDSASVQSTEGKGEEHCHDQEEKEQNSPVCVLDLPFVDEDEEEKDDDDAFDHLNSSCCYELVQRARQHLLRKLQKFEELADLEEPIKKLDYEEEEEEEGPDDSSPPVSVKSNSEDGLKPAGMKRLISDLISEEEGQTDNDGEDYELLIRRVWKRLGSWEAIEPSTIELMVGFELSKEVKKSWKHGEEDISEAATDVEMLIFSVLVEELVDDLVN